MTIGWKAKLHLRDHVGNQFYPQDILFLRQWVDCWCLIVAGCLLCWAGVRAGFAEYETNQYKLCSVLDWYAVKYLKITYTQMYFQKYSLNSNQTY